MTSLSKPFSNLPVADDSNILLLQSLIQNTNITDNQIAIVKKRVYQCRGRLQLRFPAIFRDGYLLQYLLPLISANTNITHIAVGLTSNFDGGFYTLCSLLQMPNITTFDLRINNLLNAPQLFFDMIATSSLQKFTLRVNEVSNEKMRQLCIALSKSRTMIEVTFRSTRISSVSAQYLADFIAQKTITAAIDDEYAILIERKSMEETDTRMHADATDFQISEQITNYNSSKSIDSEIAQNMHKNHNSSKSMDALNINIDNEVHTSDSNTYNITIKEYKNNQNYYKCVNRLQILHLSIEILTPAQRIIISEGMGKAQSLLHLDITDCQFTSDGIKVLCKNLPNCKSLKTLSFGNNGKGSMHAFFEALDKQCFQQLLCNESHSFNVEYIDLNVVAQGIKNAKYLESLQIPLFIFTETDDESLFTFVDALCTKENLHTLQIFPLFEHLENSASDLDPILFTKITKIFTILFDNLCHAKYIKRLYIEMIGAESEFFNECAAKSFEMFLIQNCSIQELYLPFCYLIDLNPGILQSFPNCKQLISIKDDNLDFHFLQKIEELQKEDKNKISNDRKSKSTIKCNRNQNNRNRNINNVGYEPLSLSDSDSDFDDNHSYSNLSTAITVASSSSTEEDDDSNHRSDEHDEYWSYAWNYMNEEKRKTLFKYKAYHETAHRQCMLNITKPLVKYIPQCIAFLVTKFIGFETNPEIW